MKIIDKIRKQKDKPVSLRLMAGILSLYTLLAFHFPFFKDVVSNAEEGFNRGLIVVSMVIIMLTLNYFIYYLILFLGRFAGKVLIALTMIANAACFYFICTYNVLIDRDMMGNFYNTQFSEASSFLSWKMVIYIILLGIIPGLMLFLKKIKYGSWKKFGSNIAIAIAAILVVVSCNMKNFTWIDKQAPVLGSRLMPWSYVINSFRYYSHWKKLNQKETLLPDATFNDSRDIVVLVIGESARSQNFSLYGYERQTNPLMMADSVTALKARASDTYTTAAVKAILQHKRSRTLYEILPNYLNRNGVDVIWRTSNWGTPPIHIEKKYSKKQLAQMYPECDGRYDGILLAGLKEEIEKSTSDKIFIGLHTYTSHGPSYFSNTPDEFKKYLPECTTVEMAQADRQELINAYDNTIIYTDYLMHQIIDMVRCIPDRRSCVIFISDHGESLGENSLYMHGVPLSMAPEVQTSIPFVVWTSDKTLKIKEMDLAGHHNIYHTVLRFLGAETEVYESSNDIFE
jgi:lipid A ethanolaminephosphotransferase